MATDDEFLQRMMEDAGRKVDVLTTLHDDLAAVRAGYVRFSRKMLVIISILAAIAITALVLSYRLIDDVRVQGDKTSELTAGLTLITTQNRDLIAGLDRVAKEAQLAGARTSREQCSEIEKLKTAIRAVIRSSPQGRSAAADVAAARFARKRCNRLPNAKPVSP